MREQEAVPLLHDRREAGRKLAEHLHAYNERPDVLVLALPRGGVPVGFEIARKLNLPLDVFLVRKLGVPWHPELAMGAVASGGFQTLNPEIIASLKVDGAQILHAIQREEQLLKHREHLFRGDRPMPPLEGRTLIVVDDGLATGSSMRAAIAALRSLNPKRIVVAVPVSSRATWHELNALVDEGVCLATPEPFWAVGQWYMDFSPTTDEEVKELLQQANPPQGPQAV